MNSTIETDLGYLRKISQRGASAPFLGGPYLVWWGSLAAVAYLAQYAVASGSLGGGGELYLIIWTGFGIVGATGQRIISHTLIGKAGSGSAGNEASRVAWIGAVAAIVSYLLGAVLTSGDGDYGAFDASVPIVFAAYAMALAVSGWLTNSVPVKLGTLAALATVTVSTLFLGSTDLWLVAAGGAAAAMVVPGLAAVAAARRADG